MYTLSIEHGITDFPTWKRAFDSFAEARTRGGVLSYRIRRPAGDEHYLVIELDFASQDRAEAFGQFLRSAVWSSRDASPGLAGEPKARVLVTVH